MGCVFCTNTGNDTLFANEHFYLKVGLGIVTPGHIMIIPKKHYSCFGATEQYLDHSFFEIKQKALSFVSLFSGEFSLIEYGAWGQSVPHAHIHIIPTQIPHFGQFNLFEGIVVPSAVSFRKATWQEQREFFRKHAQYVSFEECSAKHRNDTFYLCEVHRAAEQGIELDLGCLSYRIYFTQQGIPGVLNWKEMTQEEKIHDEQKRAETIRRWKEVCPNAHSWE